MNWTRLGLVAGLLLGVAAAFGGFGAFAITVLLGAIGLLVGRHLDGGLELDNLLTRTRSADHGTGAPR